MKYYLIVCVAILLNLNFLTYCRAEEIIKISTEDYPPHTSQRLKHYGLNCHIVTQAFAVKGITVKYSFYPAKRSFYKAKHGEVDGTLPWVRRADREEYFYYSDPVFTGGVDSFFYLKSYKFAWDPKKPDYTKLKDIAIGGILGHNYGENIQEAEKAGLINFERVPTLKQNFEKLLLGRIQLCIVVDIVGYYELQTQFSPENISMMAHTPQDTRPTAIYHLLISKKSKKGKYFLNAFNSGLKQLKKSGKYDQFVEESLQGDYIVTKIGEDNRK